MLSRYYIGTQWSMPRHNITFDAIFTCTCKGGGGVHVVNCSTHEQTNY